MILSTVSIPPTSNMYVNEYKIPISNNYNLQNILNELMNIKQNSENNLLDTNHTISIGDMELKNANIEKSFAQLYDIEKHCYINLKFPIQFIVESDENGFYYKNEMYNLYVYGINQEDAENQLLKELYYQYKAYAMEPDENLDVNAIKLKNNLIGLIG